MKEDAAVDNRRYSNTQNRRSSTGGCSCARRQGRSSGCGECTVLMSKIRAVDFAIQETVLYLDAYPCNQEALEYYHSLIEIREKLMSSYQTACGPLTNDGNTSRTNWEWISSPWPWEIESNV